MQVALQAIHEPQPGEKWSAAFERLWPAYRKWFLRQGDAARPSYLTCRRALAKHMPELLDTYDRLCELAGGGDSAARLLSLYRPPPYLTGCSQAVWSRDEPTLVRNYDYSPRLWDAILLHTAWNGRSVISMSDVLWGVVDGFSEAGLAVSLSFGGRKVVGDGFGMPLILRYILEFCDTAREAAQVLKRVPSHMAYNVTIVDASGDFLTAFVAPDRPAHITRRPIATNHQHVVDWAKYAEATASLERERFLAARLEDEAEKIEHFVERFLRPPLFTSRFEHGWGTLYTAAYRLGSLRADYRWPTLTLTQSFTDFAETAVTIDFRDLTPSVPTSGSDDGPDS